MNKDQVLGIVGKCRFENYSFHVDGDENIFVHASYCESDTVTGVMMRQRTRRWLISDEATPSDVVRTCFKCVLTSMEHRAREWFTYRDAAIFNPHFDADELVEIHRNALSPSKGSLDKLAHSLAYTNAVAVIESATLNVAGVWQSMEKADFDDFGIDFDYLEKRGLIERHPERLDWIRVRPVAEAKA